MQTSYSRTLNFVLGFLIIGLVTYMVYFSESSEYKDDYTKQKNEIDSLTIEFNKLQIKHNAQDSIIKANNDSIGLLQKSVNTKAEEIKNLQNYYGKKIKDIGRYTPTQLDSFFSGRYQE